MAAQPPATPAAADGFSKDRVETFTRVAVKDVLSKGISAFSMTFAKAYFNLDEAQFELVMSYIKDQFQFEPCFMSMTGSTRIGNKQIQGRINIQAKLLNTASIGSANPPHQAVQLINQRPFDHNPPAWFDPLDFQKSDVDDSYKNTAIQLLITLAHRRNKGKRKREEAADAEEQEPYNRPSKAHRPHPRGLSPHPSRNRSRSRSRARRASTASLAGHIDRLEFTDPTDIKDMSIILTKVISTPSDPSDSDFEGSSAGFDVFRMPIPLSRFDQSNSANFGDNFDEERFQTQVSAFARARVPEARYELTDQFAAGFWDPSSETWSQIYSDPLLVNIGYITRACERADADCNGIVLFVAHDTDILKRLPSSLLRGRVPFDTDLQNQHFPLKGSTPPTSPTPQVGPGQKSKPEPLQHAERPSSVSDDLINVDQTGAVVSARHYPRMREAPLRSQEPVVSETPAVHSIGPAGSGRKFTSVLCRWLSSGAYENVDSASGSTLTGALFGQDKLAHITALSWQLACQMVGFNPDHWNPDSGVFLEKWSEEFYLLSHQFFSAAFCLRVLLSGGLWAILGHTMGVGKTPISIGIFEVLRAFRWSYLSKSTDEYMNPYTLFKQAPTETIKQCRERLTEEKPEDQEWDLRVSAGPFLVVPPPLMIQAWCRSLNKFSPSTPVIVASAKISERKTKTDYGNHVLSFRSKLPSRFQPALPLRVSWFQSNAELSVIQMLQKWKDLRHKRKMWREHRQEEWYLWCSTAVIICTAGNLSSRIRLTDYGTDETPVGVKPDDSERLIDTEFGYVFMDEFHEITGWQTFSWRNMMSIPGSPQFIWISGTFLNKPSSLVAPLMAAESSSRCIPSPTNGTTDPGTGAHYPDRFQDWHASLLKASRKGESAIEEFDDIDNQVRRDWLPAKSFVTLRQICRVLDKDVSTGGALVDHKAGQSTTTITNKPEAQDLARLLNDSTIQFTTSTPWGPDQIPIVNMAPVRVLDINVPIPDEYRDHIAEPYRVALKQAVARAKHVKTATAKNGGEKSEFSQAGFLQSIHKFRCISNFPCFEALRESNPKFKASLLLDLTLRSAKAIVDDALEHDKEVAPESDEDEAQAEDAPFNDPRLTEFDKAAMPHMIKLPQYEAMVDIVEHTLSETNPATGHRRKVVIGALTPMNVAAAYRRIRYQSTLSNSNIDGPADVAIVGGWMTIKERNEIFERFRKDDSGPHVIVVSYAAMRSGIELVPADCMILMDGCWQAALIEQVIGRLRRPRNVQKSRLVEVYRIIAATPWLDCQDWFVKRNYSVADLRNAVAAVLPDEDLSVFDLEVRTEDPDNFETNAVAEKAIEIE